MDGHGQSKIVNNQLVKQKCGYRESKSKFIKSNEIKTSNMYSCSSVKAAVAGQAQASALRLGIAICLSDQPECWCNSLKLYRVEPDLYMGIMFCCCCCHRVIVFTLHTVLYVASHTALF